MLLTKNEAQAQKSAASEGDALEFFKGLSLATIDAASKAKRAVARVAVQNQEVDPDDVKSFLEALDYTVTPVTFTGEAHVILVVSGF